MHFGVMNLPKMALKDKSNHSGKNDVFATILTTL
jgi:hypothetical protein